MSREDALVDRPRTIDLFFTLAWTAFTLISLRYLDDMRSDDAAVGPLSYVLVSVAGIAAAMRRTWPSVALLVTMAAVGSYLVIGYPYGPIFGVVVLTVYSAARWLPIRRSVPLAIVAYAALCLHLLTNEAAIAGAAGLLPAMAWVAIPATVGAARRSVVAAGLRERRAAEDRAVTAERLHLAQEVHDVVGHGLAAIQMQADIALHVARGKPDEAIPALRVISRASAQALDDLRETLRRVHPEGTATAPTPGLARVPELVQRVHDAGVRVDLSVEGEAKPLPTGADVAVYRVLQESLTNVVKHATHPHATVRIRHTADTVSLEVISQAGVGSTPPEDGLGIGGMRRRITMLEGDFEAGVEPSTGRFRVSAVIPRQLENR